MVFQFETYIKYDSSAYRDFNGEIKNIRIKNINKENEKTKALAFR